MKTRVLTTVFIIAACVFSLNAQAPQLFNYQAVVRDVSGNPIINSTVGIQLSILQGSSTGTAVCVEEFAPLTNEYGIITLEVGSVNTVDFESIDWSAGPYFLKVELDAAGGTSYTEMGSSQLLSVPYALHALTVSDIKGELIINNEGVLPNSEYLTFQSHATNMSRIQSHTEDDLNSSLRFWNNTNGTMEEKMRLDQQGNLSLGTITPGYKLDVFTSTLAETEDAQNKMLRLSGHSGNTDNLFFLHNRYTDGTNWNTSEIKILKQVDSTPMHYISFKGGAANAHFLEFGFNETPALTIDKLNRIGIGTSSPTRTLDVAGDAKLGSDLTLWEGTKALSFRQDVTNSWIANIGNFVSNGSTSNGWINLVGEDGVNLRYGVGAGAGSIGFSMNGLGNIGIGTVSPAAKVDIRPSASWSDEDALFIVRNNDGTPVFTVYNNGVRITVEDDPSKKGPKGGFAIGGFDPTKAGETFEFMRITPDSIRFNIANSTSKGPKGGFAIGSFDRTKKGVLNEDFMYITPNGSGSGEYNNFMGYRAGYSNISGTSNYFSGYKAGYTNRYGDRNIFIGREAGYYHNPPNLSASGDNNIFLGYRSGYSTTSGTSHATNNIFIGNNSGYQTRSGQNVIIGNDAGKVNTSGVQLVFVGNRAGENSTGSHNVFIGDNTAANNTSGARNTSVGAVSGTKLTTASDNTFLGASAGFGYGTGTLGSSNVFVGSGAGYAYNASIGSNNVFVGYRAGYKYGSSGGSGNVFLGYMAGSQETGHNRLYIANSNTTEPLIFGYFTDSWVKINGSLRVRDVPYGDYQNLQWNASSGLIYQDNSSMRYKENITELNDEFSKLLELSPMTYTRPDKPEKWEIGYIAEDFADAGLDRLVWYDEEGRPDGINYEKIILYSNENIKNNQRRVIELENEVSDLKLQLKQLEEALNSLLSKQN